MKHILKTIRGSFQSNRVRKQYELIEKAILEKAALVSDLEFNRTMSDFYTGRVIEIDAHVDWWGFAQAKQKQQDHQEDFQHYEQRIIEADAKVLASKRAFEALQKEINGQPTSN